MKRVIIKNLLGVQVAGADMEDPTSWLESGLNGNWWGKPQRKQWFEDCSPAEIASAINVETVVVKEATENEPAVTRQQLTLPATYTVEITDLTAEIDAENTRINQIKSLKQRVKQLSGQNDLTAAELKEAVMKMIKAFALNRDLD